MAKRVTITDVAKEAGVSIKTVSNVLNNTGNMRDETRAHVQKVMDRLGYRVNLSARSMRTGATKLIGLGISDFSQPFSPYLADSVMKAARSRGYGVLISTFGYRNQKIESILAQTHKLPADGWIFFPDAPLSENSVIFQQNYPVVLASEFNAFDRVDSVSMQSYEAVYELVQKLIRQGKTRIAFAGAMPRRARESDDDYFQRISAECYGAVAVRTKAFCDALSKMGIAIDPDYLLASKYIDHKNGASVADTLLENVRRNEGVGKSAMPEVILCANDALAFGLMHELAKNGVNIPEDVQIIGFDNVPEARYSNPSLTSIDPHVEEYAKTAVDFLIERIEGVDAPARRVSLGCDVVTRRSAQL